MRRVDERSLQVRLARVEALHRQATTRGEREAAARARERLIDRIGRVRSEDPVVQFVHEHIHELLVPGAPPAPPAPLPSAEELLAVLARWERGTLDTDEIAEWAAEVVDRVELPADPLAEGAVVGEVLLQLAAVHHVPLAPGDVPALRRFVERGDWDEWFAVVARVALR